MHVDEGPSTSSASVTAIAAAGFAPVLSTESTPSSTVAVDILDSNTDWEAQTWSKLTQGYDVTDTKTVLHTL